jgi:hypothetical protein
MTKTEESVLLSPPFQREPTPLAFQAREAARDAMLASTQAVLSDLVKERFPRVYIVQTEGAIQEILGVFLTLEAAQSLVEGRMGVKLEWKHSNAHGNVWWPASNGTGTITDHEIQP